MKCTLHCIEMIYNKLVNVRDLDKVMVMLEYAEQKDRENSYRGTTKTKGSGRLEAA